MSGVFQLEQLGTTTFEMLVLLHYLVSSFSTEVVAVCEDNSNWEVYCRVAETILSLQGVECEHWMHVRSKKDYINDTRLLNHFIEVIYDRIGKLLWLFHTMSSPTWLCKRIVENNARYALSLFNEHVLMLSPVLYELFDLCLWDKSLADVIHISKLVRIICFLIVRLCASW